MTNSNNTVNTKNNARKVDVKQYRISVRVRKAQID